MTRTIEYHGISKDEAVAKLNDKGYRAVYEKGTSIPT